MGIQRHRFNIVTDTGGDYVDTGAPIEGFVLQVAVDTGSLDTGCDFTLRTVQSGMNIAHWSNAGGSAWTRAPRIVTFDTGGAAVGDQSPVVAHDRLRLTVAQSDGATGSKTCTLYVWTGW
jgi:hypothetical protein